MNKYNIKVGDYVETCDGGIGYVTNVNSDYFFVKLIINKEKEEYPPDNKCYYEFKDEQTIPRDFRRIGTNDFTKKENYFEPISKYNQNGIITYADKLNELIFHINAIQERLNKDGSKEERH